MRHPIAVLTALICLAVSAEGAAAAVLHVNATADGPGDCVAAGGTCTLRAAIVEAKTGTPGEPDTIVLGPGTHVNDAQDFIVSLSEQLTIVGAGARSTEVRETAGGDGRVFLVEQGATLTLRDLTVAGARDNSGVLLFGGDNALRGERVTFTGNSALARGGAIDGTGGAVELVDSTVAGNAAAGAGGMAGRGGGIFSGGAGASLALTNVTVTGNSAGSGSGVYVGGGQARLTAVTLAGNVPGPGAGAEGGELLTAAAAPPVESAGSILGGCAGTAPASLGHNLEPGVGCGLAAPGDRPASDPLLGPLADNGGPTDTLAPGPGSAAIDAAGACPPPAADQRGVARPQGAACDIGAYEVAVPTAPAPVPPAAPVAPRITRLSIVPRAFTVARRPRTRTRTRRAAAGRGERRRRRAGRPTRARVRYRLTADAVVRFRFERARPGRRAGGRCVRARGQRRSTRRCRRWVRVRGGLRREGRAGANALRLTGRVGARRLRPGRYRLVAVPRANGVAGRAVRAGFRIARGARR